MKELWTLTYADRRAAVNSFRSIMRHPWRIALWVGFVTVILALGYSRTLNPSRHEQPFWQVALLDSWVCLAVGAFGLLLANGGSRMAGFFGSRAEALLLVRTPLAPPVVAAYLQARAAASTVAQTVGRFAYVLLIGFPVGTTPLGLLREGVLVVAVTVALACVPLPRALARGWWKACCLVAGWTIALAAMLPLLRDVLIAFVRTPAAFALAAHLPRIHPGKLIGIVAAGNLEPVAAALGVTAAAVAIFAIAARDAYPELYTVSLAHLELREQLTTHSDVSEPLSKSRTKVVSGSTPLRGALAFVWLDTLAWLRRANPIVTGLLAVLSVAGGAAAGAFASAGGSEVSFSLVFGVFPNIFIAVGSTGGLRLSADLQRPLFWLGDDALAARLAAWAFAPIWRDAAFVVLLSLGYVAFTSDVATACTIVVGGLALATISRGVQLAIFALLPNALDRRGPAVFLRLFLSYAFVTPVAVAGGVAGFLAHAPLTGALFALPFALAEAAGLTAFAAWRLGGRTNQLSMA